MKVLINIFCLVILASCSSLNIFQISEKKSAESSFDLLTKEYEHVLMPDDKLSISVWNHDDLSIGSVFSIYNTNESFGKWVLIAKDSTAKIPHIGIQKIAGLTIEEAEVLIAQKMGEHIKNPIIEIHVLNRKVTILGEVKAPGNYLLEKELNTLVEYIGKAQGFGFYAETEHIQVIRNEMSYEINLSELTDFRKKNIYLQANDIIYIPSKKGKKLDMKAPVLIPFASLITAIGVFVSVVAK